MEILSLKKPMQTIGIPHTSYYNCAWCCSVAFKTYRVVQRNGDKSTMRSLPSLFFSTAYSITIIVIASLTRQSLLVILLICHKFFFFWLLERHWICFCFERRKIFETTKSMCCSRNQKRKQSKIKYPSIKGWKREKKYQTKIIAPRRSWQSTNSSMHTEIDLLIQIFFTVVKWCFLVTCSVSQRCLDFWNGSFGKDLDRKYTKITYLKSRLECMPERQHHDDKLEGEMEKSYTAMRNSLWKILLVEKKRIKTEMKSHTVSQFACYLWWFQLDIPYGVIYRFALRFFKPSLCLT